MVLYLLVPQAALWAANNPSLDPKIQRVVFAAVYWGGGLVAAFALAALVTWLLWYIHGLRMARHVMWMAGIGWFVYSVNIIALAALVNRYNRFHEGTGAVGAVSSKFIVLPNAHMIYIVALYNILAGLAIAALLVYSLDASTSDDASSLFALLRRRRAAAVT